MFKLFGFLPQPMPPPEEEETPVAEPREDLMEPMPLGGKALADEIDRLEAEGDVGFLKGGKAFSMAKFVTKNKPVRLAFAGLPGHGKSSASKIVAEYLNKERQQLASIKSFAHAIKSIVSIMFGIELGDMYDEVKKEEVVERLGKSPRQLLQEVGTDLIRNNLNAQVPDLKIQGADLWAEIVFQSIRTTPESEPILIDDCRFDNEYEGLKKLGFTVIRILRPSVAAPSTLHASDNGCGYDELLINDGTFEELRAKLLARFL